MTDQPDYAAGETPEGHPDLPPGVHDRLTAQAWIVRQEANRLYVHDPKTTAHPSYHQFNAFLDQVLGLCDSALPQEGP